MKSEAGNKSTVVLRKAVREILSALPEDRRASVPWLVGMINQTTPHVADEESIQEALGWNHDRGWVQSFRNHELERYEWTLTNEGRQQEGLAK